VASTATVYWGWNTATILNEAQVLALVGTAVDTDQFGGRLFPPANFDNFAYFWWPDTFPALTANPNGFVLGAFGVSMATDTEGYPNPDGSGYFYSPLTVGGVPGQLRRSFYGLGGAGNQTILVQ
jgi:hypothetical protein